MRGHPPLITVLAGAMTILIAPGPPGAAPAAPALKIAGPAFTVDGRPRFLLLVSYFDALRASDATLEADFAFLRRCGLDGVRHLPQLVAVRGRAPDAAGIPARTRCSKRVPGACVRSVWPGSGTCSISPAGMG